MGIGKATNASHAAEVMIERSILLHQDHDMFDVLDGSRTIVSRNGQHTVQVEWQGGCKRGRSHQFQERTTIAAVHVSASSNR
jgi:hypothetical protein